MEQHELRQAVAAGLEAAGRPDLAERASSRLSTMLGPVLELPGHGAAVVFEAVPHSGASFYVGLASGQVFCLTGDPGAFAGLMRASNVQVASEDTAEQVARAFVETTRLMNAYSRVLDSADDIRWDTRPGRGPAPEVLDRLRATVRPPAATAAGPGGYEVSVFVLNGAAVERRLLTVSTDGAVTQQQADDVVSGLPVPVSI